LPVAERRAAAQTFTNRHAADLPEPVRNGIMTETLAILENPQWAALFGPGSLAEVPITGMAGKRLVSGQIDRLLVTDSEIWIIDYKTNRPPPLNPKDIPAAYRAQIQAYSDIVARIYPGRAIRGFLLWTDGPALMELKP
jgi:ATP-dependent helicase/nuclease subunit A